MPAPVYSGRKRGKMRDKNYGDRSKKLTNRSSEIKGRGDARELHDGEKDRLFVLL